MFGSQWCGFKNLAIMISKKDKKTISGLVKGLPEMVSKKEKEKVTISGGMLLENGIGKLTNGKIVDTNKVYLTEKPKSINHKTEAENAFKKGGIEAVKSYVSHIKQICLLEIKKETA